MLIQAVNTVNTVCSTQITGLDLDVDYSGPHLLIDITFASTPSPVEIEIERYLADGRTEPVSQLSNIVGRTRVALHFNTKYRGRARAGTCPWSPWVDRQIGPPNPCGGCAAPPSPPAPKPDDECVAAGEGLNWEPQRGRLQVTRMEAPPPEECHPQ